MPRYRKPQIVKTVTDSRTQEVGYVKLDRNQLLFFAEYQGEKFENPACEPVEKWLTEKLRMGRNLNWTRVICVAASYLTSDPRDIREHSGHAEIDLQIRRFCLAVTSDGLLLETAWEYKTHNFDYPKLWKEKHPEWVERPEPSEAEVRIASAKKFTDFKLEPGQALVLPIIRDKDDEKYHYRQGTWSRVYLAYTEETWVGLNQLIDAIMLLGARLDELLKTSEGMARIIEIGSTLTKALPPGSTGPQGA